MSHLFKCLSEGELKNFAKPHILLYDQVSVLYELTEKLSASEKQIIYEIVNKSIEKDERQQLIGLFDEVPVEAFSQEELHATAFSFNDDDYDAENFTAKKKNEEISIEKKSIFQSHINYGATFDENKAY